jgi:hypothetical protein
MVDPAFDLAFCLAHLLLKTIWLAHVAEPVLASFTAMNAAYAAGGKVDEGFETRAAALIGALLLARVDGKSPAGYLDASQDEVVRCRAKTILVEPGLAVRDLPEYWRRLA